MKKSKIIISLVILIFCSAIQAQNKKSELDRLIEIGLENNKGLSAFELKMDASKENIKTAYHIHKTTVYYGRDHNNIAPNNKALNIFGVEQSFLFSTVYGARRSLNKSLWEQDQVAYELQKK